MIKSSKKHLFEAKESYFQHMKNASKIGFELFIGSLMAIIHSIIPGIFQTATSNKIKKLHSFLEERRKNT